MGNPFLEESTDLVRLDTRDIADPNVVSTVQQAEEIDKQIVTTNGSDVTCIPARDTSHLAPCDHEEADTREEECLSSFVYVEEIAGAIVEKNGEPLKHCHNVIRDVCCPGGQIN
ncbi:unnamed protein product [Boreogadus saida]